MLMKSLKGKKKHLKNPATVPEGFVLFFLMHIVNCSHALTPSTACEQCDKIN